MPYLLHSSSIKRYLYIIYSGCYQLSRRAVTYRCEEPERLPLVACSLVTAHRAAAHDQSFTGPKLCGEPRRQVPSRQRAELQSRLYARAVQQPAVPRLCSTAALLKLCSDLHSCGHSPTLAAERAAAALTAKPHSCGRLQS